MSRIVFLSFQWARTVWRCRLGTTEPWATCTISPMQNPIKIMLLKFWTLSLRPDGLSLMQMLQGKKTDLQKSLRHVHASKMFKMYVCFFLLPELELLCLHLCSEFQCIVNGWITVHNAVLGNRWAIAHSRWHQQQIHRGSKRKMGRILCQGAVLQCVEESPETPFPFGCPQW